MTLGKVAVFTLGAVIGGVIGYAAVRSDAVRNVTRSTIKAGLKAKDWTVEQCRKAKAEVAALAGEAGKEGGEAPAA